MVSNSKYICFIGSQYRQLLAHYKELSSLPFDQLEARVSSSEEMRRSLIGFVVHLRAINNHEICYFNEDIDHYMQVIVVAHNLQQDFNALKTKSDGDCFYYSLMKLLLGGFNSTDIKLLRLAILFIFLEYEDHFDTIYSQVYDTVPFKRFVCGILRPKTWACTVVQAACSVLLNRPIHVFSYGHSLTILLNENAEMKSPLIFIHDQLHYVPLIPLSVPHKRVNAPSERLFLELLLPELVLYN